jgi:N-acetylneuraminate synthase
MKPTLIAEIGCCHAGDLDRAKYLADLAKQSGAQILKTQKRNPEESVPPQMQDQPHPNPFYSYGQTYLEHRQNLELSLKQHAELKKYCEDIDIEYFCSVWDLTSAEEIISLTPKQIKIPSAMNDNWDLLSFIYNNFDGDIHISLGMANWEKRKNIIDQISNYPGCLRRTIFYHCTSVYPCPFEKLYLNEIRKLVFTVGPMRVGFSNHGYGIAADIAALALGATYFERHFIDDRTFRHTDAPASLEPSGLAKLARDLRNVAKSLQDKPDEPDPEEEEQRKKLRG